MLQLSVGLLACYGQAAFGSQQGTLQQLEELRSRPLASLRARVRQRYNRTSDRVSDILKGAWGRNIDSQKLSASEQGQIRCLQKKRAGASVADCRGLRTWDVKHKTIDERLEIGGVLQSYRCPWMHLDAPGLTAQG